MKITEKSVNLTSYTGYKVWATYDELAQILGEEAIIIDNDSQIFQWNLENRNGDICTIFDWHCNQRIYQDRDFNIDWNIGSFKSTDAMILKEEIDLKLKEIRYGRK